MESKDKLPIEPLAQLDPDGTIALFGVLPLIVIAVVAVIFVAVFLQRRKSNWQKMASQDVLEQESPEPSEDVSHLDPTQPSKRLPKDS